MSIQSAKFEAKQVFFPMAAPPGSGHEISMVKKRPQNHGFVALTLIRIRTTTIMATQREPIYLIGAIEH